MPCEHRLHAADSEPQLTATFVCQAPTARVDTGLNTAQAHVLRPNHWQCLLILNLKFSLSAATDHVPLQDPITRAQAEQEAGLVPLRCLR